MYNFRCSKLLYCTYMYRVLNSFTLNLTKIMQLHCMQTFYVILLHNHKLFGNIKSLNWFWYYAKFKYKLYYSMFTINSFTYANRFVCERVLNITKTFPLLKCLLKFTLYSFTHPLTPSFLNTYIMYYTHKYRICAYSNRCTNLNNLNLILRIILEYGEVEWLILLQFWLRIGGSTSFLKTHKKKNI